MFFEAYFVLDGDITFVLDGRTTTHGPETFVLVPAGAAHTFGNTSDAPARLLVIHAQRSTATSPSSSNCGPAIRRRPPSRNQH